MKVGKHGEQALHKYSVQNYQNIHRHNIKANPKTQDAKKVSKYMTNVAFLKQGGEVLLVKCQVTLITPDALLGEPGP